MKKKQDKYYLYLIVTVSLVIFGIILTSLVDQFKGGKTTDVRARASAATAVKITATVVDTDVGANALQVTNLAFEDTKTKLNGTWNVLLPTNAQASAYTSGTQVTLAVDAELVNIRAKTIGAIEVRRR